MIYQAYIQYHELPQLPLNLLFFIQQLNVFYVYHLQSFIHYQGNQHLLFQHFHLIHLKLYHYIHHLKQYKQVHLFHPFNHLIFHEYYLLTFNHQLSNHMVHLLLVNHFKLKHFKHLNYLKYFKHFKYSNHFMRLAFLFL